LDRPDYLTFAPTTPIPLVSTFPDEPMKRRMRPPVRALGMLMFDRIKMDVIQMPVHICWIAYRMFPKPALPNGSRALAKPRWRPRPLDSTGSQIPSREPGLEIRDAPRKICVAIGQRHDKMEMVGQQDRRIE
jgi:hypothetical protein